jgi:hypothetical protein
VAKHLPRLNKPFYKVFIAFYQDFSLFLGEKTY